MNRYEESTEVYNRLFGELPKEETDHELMEILRRFIFGDIFHSRDLDDSVRELITITILGTLQTLPQLKAHVKAALNIGVTPLEIREAMYQLAPFIGFPKTLNAVTTMNEAFLEAKVELPLEDLGTVIENDRFKRGLEIQFPIYGDEIKEKYLDIPEIPKYLTEFCFGDFYTRGGLDLKMRELLVLVVLTCIRSDAQIKSHVLGNIKVGNSKELLIAVMLQCLPYIGFPNTLNTINIIKEI